MSTIATIVRKELRSYFLSPVAVMFLGVFLLVTLFVFFTYSRFFARNIADVRPLFMWLPVLLVFLSAAVTMRAWSEEEKIGTLEILLTLPLRTRDLVLGKFLAGMTLVALALALTLPLPVSVSMRGELDWGPVVGGYLGALLLAAAYMAIGLCVSARTDNQIVSLMVTAAVCALLYLVGSESVVPFFGEGTASLLRALGSGSRFESIERGVIDLRDVVYYASIAGFFLLLNVEFLDLKRQETSTPSARSRTRARWITITLAGLNFIVLNLWLAPLAGPRADLTANGEYSLSDSTENVLARLDEPLIISAYFSERTHPLLAPLVPQIRDLLGEYEIYGRGRVRVEFRNPNESEELEEELGQAYNIRTVPFRVSGRHEESVVNSYFHILLRYADQYQVLTFQDLIEIDARDADVDVRLRNLEYDLTRAIKQLTEGFRSIDAVFAGLPESAALTAYISPGTLPAEFADVPGRIRKVAADLVERAAGKFEFEEIDPSTDAKVETYIYQNYGFRPMSTSLFGGDRYWLYLLFESGDKLEAIFLQGDLTEASMRSTIEASIKRATPGFLKTVAIMTEQPVAAPRDPNLPPQLQPPPPQPEYRELQRELDVDFTVTRDTLKQGFVPGGVDVLIVARPGELDDRQMFAIDQFLMRGGSVIVLAGAYDASVETGTVAVTKTDKDLLTLLEAWEVKIEPGFVLDEQNARFPVPIQEKRGLFTLQRIHYMDYPFFVDIRRTGFNRTHPALSGLQNVVINWGSEIDLTTVGQDVETEILLRSSDRSWTLKTKDVLPKTVSDAAAAFPPGTDLTDRPMAATLVGRFPSYFADRPSPLFTAGDETGAATEEDGDETGGDSTGRTLKQSSASARLVLVGSSAFASDLVQGLGSQLGASGGIYRGNFQLVHNLIDWAVADTDLLQIRGSGAFARTLVPLSDAEKTRWELANYLVVLMALAIVVGIAATTRRRARPMLEANASGQGSGS
ncbi:MAG: ABC transporter permease [Myxococcales bacterium]|nr:MAG: ABC transporter permease [Myxococcales bacterium]